MTTNEQSMEAVGSNVLVLVVLVAALLTTVGVITCVVTHYQHHHHHNHHHYLHQSQNDLNSPFSKFNTTTVPMLALEATMERERCALRDRQVRLHSVRNDLELDLPTSIHLPDGEEIPYGSSTRLHIRDAEQESEIYQKCIRPPPNRTIHHSDCSLPYRSQSTGLLSSSNCNSDWPVRCHSMSRYTAANSPSVILPNIRNQNRQVSAGLAKITWVPCLTDRRSTVSTTETSSALSSTNTSSISSTSGSRLPS